MEREGEENQNLLGQSIKTLQVDAQNLLSRIRRNQERIEKMIRSSGELQQRTESGSEGN